MLNRILSAALTLACVALTIALIRHGTQQKHGPSGAAAPWASPQPTVAKELALLDRRIHDLRLDNVTLDEAILMLSEQTKVNICADWRTLGPAGLSQTQLLRLHLDHVTLGDALNVILKALMTPNGSEFAFSVRDGVITVATSEAVARNTRTECFNIRALVEELRPGFRYFGWPRDNAFRDPEPVRIDPTNEEITETVVHAITSIVAPESWRDAGGTIGTIIELAGLLVITQTPENLAAVGQVLQQFHQSSRINSFPPFARATASPTPSSGGFPSTQPITQYVNLQPLIEKLQWQITFPTMASDSRVTHMHAEINKEISRLLTDTIDPGSWQTNGGTIGKIYMTGPVMFITQTPANLRAALLMLDEVYRAASTHHVLPATRPSPTTGGSGPK